MSAGNARSMTQIEEVQRKIRPCGLIYNTAPHTRRERTWGLPMLHCVMSLKGYAVLPLLISCWMDHGSKAPNIGNACGNKMQSDLTRHALFTALMAAARIGIAP
jgi:hypothetical protein